MAIRLPRRGSVPRRLKRRTIYRNPWVTLHVDSVLYPNGRVAPEHHVLTFTQPASAAVVTDARGRVLFIRSYRYVTSRVQWEIPAGRGDGRENALQTARREVREETGYDTRGHKLLYSYHPMNGVADQLFNVVTCKVGRRVGEMDPGEVAAVDWFSWPTIRRMIRRGQIHDGLTLTSLLLVLSKIRR